MKDLIKHKAALIAKHAELTKSKKQALDNLMINDSVSIESYDAVYNEYRIKLSAIDVTLDEIERQEKVALALELIGVLFLS